MHRAGSVTRAGLAWLPFIVATVVPTFASGENEATPETTVDDGEPTAAQLAQAPVPGAESGRADAPDQDSLLRDIGQGVLLPPRVVFEIVMAPVRGSVYILDRYRLVDWWKRIFFDSTYTYGVYPTLRLDNTYGLSVGGRFVHRDLFGRHEHLSILGSYGGEFRALVAGGLRSGDRLGEHVHVQADGSYERRPEDSFYGIGNISDAEETNFRQRIERGFAILDVRAVDSLHVRGAGAITDIELGPSTHGTPINTVFDVNTLTGWSGTRNVYGELELRWDRRRFPVALDGRELFDHGELAGIYAGYVHELATSGVPMAPVPGDYWRYGGEAQKFIRLAPGPRVLVLRAHVDAVTGDVDEVAFSQLPKLGGRYLLRGYPRDRFRDRIAGVGTIQYEWALNQYVMASVFSDIGRVADSWEDFDPSGLRVGYGVGLQLYAKRAYLAALTLASSIDGGVFVELAFDPVFDIEPRVEWK